MLVHELFNADEFGFGKSVVGRERNGAQPKLGLHFLTGDVDVRWLVAFTAVEMKAIRPDAQHGWHEPMLAILPQTGNE
jgi:hypothetical protein